MWSWAWQLKHGEGKRERAGRADGRWMSHDTAARQQRKLKQGWRERETEKQSEWEGEEDKQSKRHKKDKTDNSQNKEAKIKQIGEEERVLLDAPFSWRCGMRPLDLPQGLGRAYKLLIWAQKLPQTWQLQAKYPPAVPPYTPTTHLPPPTGPQHRLHTTPVAQQAAPTPRHKGETLPLAISGHSRPFDV